MCKTVLVTGATGMIGSHTVKALLQAGYDVIGLDRRESSIANEKYTHIIADLADQAALQTIFHDHKIDRVIHLAALAHTAGVKDLSFKAYYNANVICAANVFRLADENSIPVLFTSTVDVYGFTKEIVTADTPTRPVTAYGKTKALAEEECRSICKKYTIFRFSPVYTETVKRDIQKRYYLKYPNWAYIVGKGSEYEVLNVDRAASQMVAWCGEEVRNDIRIIKDADRLKTRDAIAGERKDGRAKHVLHVPRWLMTLAYGLSRITGKNKYTYLLNKVIHPLRTQ